MAYKLITAPLAFATSVSQVVAQECAQNLLTTHAGDGKFRYLAKDDSSPVFTANLDNGVLVSESESSDGTLFDTGARGFLQNYTNVDNYIPPTLVGQLAFANTSTFANASDSNWLLGPSCGTNIYNLWHNEPDGTPWYYFQYVDWVVYYPPNCEVVAILTNVPSPDLPTC
ncbi:hypothetical protein LI328DRAFT_155480 [Trichoderma asperelloides]|nr:hypothetical protein LI328DRAFT_155480 [Trichoderma asperelloides]